MNRGHIDVRNIMGTGVVKRLKEVKGTHFVRIKNNLAQVTGIYFHLTPINISLTTATNPKGLILRHQIDYAFT